MNFACKYYGLAAAHIAINSGKDDLYTYLPKAIKIVADNEYSSGAWLNYLDLVHTFFVTHSLVSKNLNLYESTESDSIVYHTSIIKYVAERFVPELKHLFDFKTKDWMALSEDILELKDIHLKKFDTYSPKKMWEMFEEQISGKPFNDIGHERIIEWSIFGSKWTLKFKNDYITNSVAEQFLAILQILLVELAQEDLYLIKSKVNIEILKVEDKLPSCEILPSNKERLCLVKLPLCEDENQEDTDMFQSRYVAFASSILGELSLLPQKTFLKIIEEIIKKDLSSKVTIAKPYELLFRYYTNETQFNNSKRELFSRPFPNLDFNCKCPQVLEWKDSIAPTYDKRKNLELIKKHYNHIAPVEISLYKLNRLKIFQNTIKSLRERGWLDWQIFMALTNIIVNYKIRQRYPCITLEKYQEIYADHFLKKENEWYVEIQPVVVSLKNFEENLNEFIPMTVLRSYGLELQEGTPDFEGILEFLKKRFNYFVDDIDCNVFDF